MPWILAASVALANPLCASASSAGWRQVDGMLLSPEVGALDYKVDPLAAELFGRLLLALHARDIEVVVVIAPPRPRVVAPPGPSSGVPRYWLEDRARFSATLAWFRAHGARAPDLFQLGLDLGAGGQSLFLPADGHFSAVGSIAAATAIAEEIRGIRRWPWYGSRPTELAADGEKAAPIGMLAKQLAEVCNTRAVPEFRQPHYVLDVEEDPSALLLGDESPPEVVMASSSFGHPMYYLPQALEAELDTPVLNFTVASGRVTSALRAWLESFNYREHPPDVLVWVFSVTHLFGGTADHSGSLASASGFRQLLPLVDGPCLASEAARTLDVRANGTLLAPSEAGIDAGGHYLVIEGEALRAARYAVGITYASGASERVVLSPDELLPLRERATLEFEQSSGKVAFIRLHPPEGTSLEGVSARVCAYRAATAGR